MGLKEKAVKGSVFNTVRSVLESGIALVSFLFFARWLKPEAFGVYALSASFVAFAKAIQDLGFSRALIQFETVDSRDRTTAFWTMLGIGIVLTGVLWALSPLVSIGFGMKRAGPVLFWLSMGVFLHGISDGARATLNRRMKFFFLGMVSVIATFFGACVGLFMAYRGWGVWSLVAYQLTITATGTFGFWWGSTWIPGIDWSSERFQKMYSFGVPVIGKKIVKRFGERTDDILIGYFFHSTVLGYYAVAYRILKISRQLLVRTFINVAIPVFSRLQSERQRLKRV
ncbi:MAG: oligosaccharide flippase family protein, partial [bacterium]